MKVHSQFRAVVFMCLPLLLGMSLSAQPQAGAKASVRGVVRHARNGEPLSGARVMLVNPFVPVGMAALSGGLSPDYSGVLATTTTNAAGEFVLTDIDASSYKLVVMNNGFVRYDSARMVLTSGQARGSIVVRLKPTATVSGRVASTAGRPIVGATVSLLRRKFDADGKPGLEAAATARTNDLGEYRLYWVKPGRYYVSAEGPRDRTQYAIEFRERTGRNEVSESHTTTFFPGVSEITKASPIDLEESIERRGLDLTMPPERLVAIRGRVLDPATGKPPLNAVIALTRMPLTGPQYPMSIPRWYDPATGNFEIRDLLPGRYGVSVQPDDRFLMDNRLVFREIPPAGTPWDAREITIADSGIDDVALTLQAPRSISGNIKIEGKIDGTGPVGPDGWRVTLSSTTPSFFASSSGLADAEGNFKLNALPEGTARVTMPGLLPWLYVKEARLDGVDVLNRSARFAPGNLEITVSTAAGQLSGRVIDDQMRPVEGIEAILIPNEMRDRSDLFKRSVSNAQGRFQMQGIAPGDYKVFAWERLEENSFFDPDVLKEYEARGIPVRIAESARATLDVKVITDDGP